PTDTTLIVLATLAALDQWTQAGAARRHALIGTHHLVASGATTWHGFASAIINEASVLGLLEHPPLVLAVGSSEFQTPTV
ncbi:MAG: sugar nucleotide-binding protein, partial [Rhodanobacter sp.]